PLNELFEREPGVRDDANVSRLPKALQQFHQSLGLLEGLTAGNCYAVCFIQPWLNAIYSLGYSYLAACRSPGIPTHATVTTDRATLEPDANPPTRSKCRYREVNPRNPNLT